MSNDSNQLIIIKPDDLEDVKSELREIKTYLQDLFSTNPILCKDEYISNQEVSKMLNVTTRTISDWTKKGVLKCHKVGRKLRFKRSEVIDLIERNKIVT